MILEESWRTLKRIVYKFCGTYKDLVNEFANFTGVQVCHVLNAKRYQSTTFIDFTFMFCHNWSAFKTACYVYVLFTCKSGINTWEYSNAISMSQGWEEEYLHQEKIDLLEEYISRHVDFVKNPSPNGGD